MAASSDVLVIGPAGAGKTTLVRTLTEAHTFIDGKPPASFKAHMETSPTTGVEVDYLRLPDGRSVSVREVGYSLMAMWSTYYENTATVLMVMDLSSPATYAESCVCLLEAASAPELVNKPLCVVLNKTDSAFEHPIELLSILGIDAVKRERADAGGPFRFLGASGKTGEGAQAILEWVADVL